MTKSPVRILVVDDFEPFRRFVTSKLLGQPGLRVICEVSDGMEAVEKAAELQPDLIILDIGLPELNGIEAAKEIRKRSPNSIILFLSQESSAAFVQKVFTVGASGYVVKSDAGRELLPAVKAILRGERFVGSRFAAHNFTIDSQASDDHHYYEVLVSPEPPPLQKAENVSRHEAHFYSDNASFLDAFTQFIGTALKAGNAVIAVVTESHRNNLLPRLYAYGLDLGAVIEQGQFILLDAAETLSTFLVNDLPDRTRFLEAADQLITTAAMAAKGEHPQVAICGECDPPLWTLGQGAAAIRLEQLWNEISAKYDVAILCGYPLGSFHGEQGSHMFQRICAEHTAVHAL